MPKPGGVDPLGLRQINFDLMDEVLPGVNNVAQHIRPFTVVTWAWHRAAICARKLGKTSIFVAELQDFVDRVEVIYTWSQFLRNPTASLPGRDVLAPIIADKGYVFGGDEWRRRKEIRRYSTSLSAPVNYGPGLKSLGWLAPDPKGTGAMIPNPAAGNALAAFEEEIASHLNHAAFNQFGAVELTSSEVEKLAENWALEQPTLAERQFTAEALFGEFAPPKRRGGTKLVISAIEYFGSSVDVNAVRRTMCGAPTNFNPSLDLQPFEQAWRTLQIRQVFRLVLEALFHWTVLQLDDGPKTTKALVRLFLEKSGDAPSASEWFGSVDQEFLGPVDWLDRLALTLSNQGKIDELPGLIRAALAACITEAPDKPGFERHDRLPLARARSEVKARQNEPADVFLVHVLESWVFGQHVYWSLGRGLADARARDKTILRLKVILEESGWTLAPGVAANQRNAPSATPDRLETMISLLREAGAIL
jgi:hypothetical protein